MILCLFQYGVIVGTVSNVQNYLSCGVMATAQTLQDMFKKHKQVWANQYDHV